jgi:hypothetical protein
VAIIVSTESDVKSIQFNKVLIYTGFTRSIIKRNDLPDKFFESRKPRKVIFHHSKKMERLEFYQTLEF